MSVTLVPVRPEQARAILAGDRSVVTAARGWPHADSLDALRMVSATAAGTGTFWIEAGGVVHGECGWYAPPGPDGAVEIGYGLAGPSRGRGYGTAAVRALLDWVGAQPGVRCVVATTGATNVPSRRLLERLGFAVTGSEGGLVRYALEIPPARRPDRT